MSAPDAPDRPTPEQVAEGRARTAKATKRALAALLILEALLLLLVPRAIARTDTGLGTGRTVVLLVFAVVLVVAGAMLRHSWGIALGSFLQLLVLATGVWTSAMFVLGLIFIGIWVYVLTLRHRLVGTPGGWRMLVS